MKKNKLSKKNNKEKLLDAYINFICVVGNLIYYIQAYKIFSLKSAHAVSFTAFLVSFLATASWLFYGIVKKITPLIVSCIIGLIGIFMVLVTTVIYWDV
jgi:MtN3 and saliva related transmembrane protein